MNHHMRGQRVAGVSSMDSRVLGVPGEGWPRAGCWGWGALSRWENVLGRGSWRVEGCWWGHVMPFGGVPKPGSQGRAWSPMTDGPVTDGVWKSFQVPVEAFHSSMTWDKSVTPSASVSL